MRNWRTIVLGFVLVGLSVVLGGCGEMPTSAREGRLFSDFTAELLAEYRPSAKIFGDTSIGGLSAISFDPKLGRYYLLSDDRSIARFYTVVLPIEDGTFGSATIEDVTLLKDREGNPFTPGSIDPEGIAIAPGNTVFISSEGVASEGIAPFIAQFDRATGQLLEELPLLPRYVPELLDPEDPDAQSTQGVQDNLGFEALTLSYFGRTAPASDPYRVFAATERAIVADLPPSESEESGCLRLLHYLVGPMGRPTLVAEHAYLLDPAPLGSISYGLTELLAIQPAGHFLALERNYGLDGFGAKLFEIVIANATDITRVESLSNGLGSLVPVQKQLILDFADLNIAIDNLEGMTLGPRFADGSQSLILVSDNNFSEEQFTQLLLLRLEERQST